LDLASKSLCRAWLHFILLFFYHYIACLRFSLLTTAKSLCTTEDRDSRNGSAAEDEDEVDESSNWDPDEVRAGRNDGSLCSCC
jgi:hypothetical protein